MNRFTTGWLNPKQTHKKRQMSFLFVVYCANCGQLSKVSRLGRPCPKCAASPDNLTNPDHWDFDSARIQDPHLGKVGEHV